MVVRMCNVRRSRGVVGVRKKKKQSISSWKSRNFVDGETAGCVRRLLLLLLFIIYFVWWNRFGFFLLRENELVFYTHTHTHKYIWKQTNDVFAVKIVRVLFKKKKIK